MSYITSCLIDPCVVSYSSDDLEATILTAGSYVSLEVDGTQTKTWDDGPQLACGQYDF